MDFKIFDTYNIRARLSVYVIVIAPIVVTVYMLYEPIRSISFSAIFIAVLAAFSNYLFALQRYWQRDKDYKRDAAELLYLSDKRIDFCSKQRYYSKLSKIGGEFEIFNQPSDDESFKVVCSSAIQWLKSNTRGNKLVKEENVLYGFYKNMLTFKSIGIIISLFSLILLFVMTPMTIQAFFQSNSNIALFAIDTFFVLFWMFGVTDKILAVLSDKYAVALLGALDSIDL